MGLFRKDQEQKPPANPNNMLMIRLLAIGYLMYLLYNMVTAYITGGEEAPSLVLLLVAVVIFLGGSVWIGVTTYKQYKRMQAERRAAWEEEERLEAEAACSEQRQDHEPEEVEMDEDPEEEE